jgi:lipopolysaccharide/colanic/teichoic acid biosynthesis glycosyltransferase
MKAEKNARNADKKWQHFETRSGSAKCGLVKFMLRRNNWSLVLEFHILIKTFFEVIRKRNAY